jgi:hypothetical protein
MEGFEASVELTTNGESWKSWSACKADDEPSALLG